MEAEKPVFRVHQRTLGGKVIFSFTFLDKGLYWGYAGTACIYGGNKFDYDFTPSDYIVEFGIVLPSGEKWNYLDLNLNF
jgi:hypothetical protein